MRVWAIRRTCSEAERYPIKIIGTGAELPSGAGLHSFGEAEFSRDRGLPCGSITVTTGADGRFRIVGLPPRDYIVIVRRIGYGPVSAIVHPDVDDTLRASFMLAPVSTMLDTIVITEPSIPGRLAEFEGRRSTGQGQFMTQAQIEQYDFAGVSDLLRTFHSINIINGIAVAQRAVMRLQPGPCALTFYIDGVRIPTPNVERDLPSPKEVAGIEVYVNSGEIPLQYRSFGGDHPGWPSGGFCGVVLLWTRSGT
ncbi:MAG TPA: carboxypeptidase regulatory-like domain-containing protein [Gemmatimonadaceae bacterium]|nr:carboxypeptidase regulatory-like domain-containing protein [Gemmatimonadaceae bacterium]